MASRMGLPPIRIMAMFTNVDTLGVLLWTLPHCSALIHRGAAITRCVPQRFRQEVSALRAGMFPQVSNGIRFIALWTNPRMQCKRKDLMLGPMPPTLMGCQCFLVVLRPSSGVLQRKMGFLLATGAYIRTWRRGGMAIRTPSSQSVALRTRTRPVSCRAAGICG